MHENCSNFSKWLISFATHPDVLRIRNCMGTISATVSCTKQNLLMQSVLLHSKLDSNNSWRQLKGTQPSSAFFFSLQQCPETLLNVLSNLRSLGTEKSEGQGINGGREHLWCAAVCFSRYRTARHQIALQSIACEEEEKTICSWLSPQWGYIKEAGGLSPGCSVATSTALVHHPSGSSPPGTEIRWD